MVQLFIFANYVESISFSFWQSGLENVDGDMLLSQPHAPLLSWHGIYPQRKETVLMGKGPAKSSYHVTHHITATVSHSLIET